MMFSKTMAMALAATMVCAAQAAGAEKSGSFTSIASLQHDYSAVEHPDGTIFAGPIEGTSTVVESSGGGPFAAGGHSLVKCVAYGKRSAAGLDIETACATTDADGDRLNTFSKRHAGDVDAGGGGEGSIELLGGTGRYAGVTGRCTYETDYLAGNRAITTARCMWRKSGDEN